MTTEIEKTFFDTFGIEPKLVESCTKPRHKCSEKFVKNCSECPRAWRKYPQITDRILLELICILSTYEWGYHCCYIVCAHNFEKLKEIILKDCIIEYEHIKHQVRTLFEEG